MRDFARSDHAGVQAQLDRLAALSLPEGRLGLETIRALLNELGNPHRSLPPVFHVAGTNGKGSTCAFLRAMLEADGKQVHVATSPHLVRYNERIRLAGKLIEDDLLASLLSEVLDAGEGLAPSFFEATIAATFLAFSRVAADACVVEVGLGGRFDATNVLEPDVLAACGIAALGIDHERFLLAPEDGVPSEPMARIAFEKAGITKEGVPLVTLSYGTGETLEIERAAARNGSPLAMNGRDWHVSRTGIGISYADRHGELVLPLPTLPGEHQTDNAGLAITLLRHQDVVNVTESAIHSGLRTARWPARLQELAEGPLTMLAGDQSVWLDGGHNVSAGNTLANSLTGELHLIVGMLASKNPAAIVDAFGKRVRSLTVVPVPGHDSHPVEAFGPEARGATDLETALLGIADDGYPILIAGSLYLAGEALRLNDEIPD